jgi:hypothetical protein|nr:MAG TPA_asm: hypothetical protein [Caudoviricetes sp.]
MAVNKVIYGGNTLVDLTGDTVTANDLADGVKATGSDGNPIVGLMQKVTIDAELSTSSTNPVQNKVIAEAIANMGGGSGGGVSTSEVNTWTAAQIFNNITIGIDAGKLDVFQNSPATPTTSYTFVSSEGSSLTLDLSALSTQAKNDASKVLKFKIIIFSFSNMPALKIINAGEVFVPKNTTLGEFMNVLDGMIICDGTTYMTIFHITNISQQGDSIS